MRVALVSGEVPSPHAGGIATVVDMLRGGFEERGIDVDYFCSAKFESTGFAATYLDQWGPHPLHDLTFGRSFRALGPMLDRYDVVDFHLPNARGPLLYASRLTVPTIATLHTSSIGYLDRVYRPLRFGQLAPNERRQKLGFIRIAIALERRALRNATMINCVAGNVLEEVENGYGFTNVVQTVKGVGASADHGDATAERSADAPLLFVGRLVAQKGLFDLLDALRGLPSRRELLIVGDGVLRAQLEAQVARDGLPVRFLGYLDRAGVAREMQRAAALVVPSLYETQPMVAFEAVAAALPVVAYASAAVGDAVGSLNRPLVEIEPRDVDALARALGRVCADPDFARELGAGNLAHHRAFDRRARMIDDYVDLYTSLVRRR